MKCSICKQEGHNSRNCPIKGTDEDRSYALWLKFDNITEEEASKLQAKVIEDKSKIAPKARGTSAKGNARELPTRIKEAQQIGEINGSKKK